MLRFLAVLPLIHLGACYFYLYVLYAGFGGNAVYLASLDNVFSIGISKLIPLYISLVVYFFIAHFYLIEDPVNIAERTDYRLHPSFSKPWAKIVFWALIAISILNILIIYLRLGEVWLAGLVTIIAVPLGAFTGHALARNGLPPRVWPAAWFAIYGALLLVSFAYRDGFLYRHGPVEEFFAENPHCKEFVILFPIGDQFLASDRKGLRYVLSLECEPVMLFPRETVTLGIR